MLAKRAAEGSGWLCCAGCLYCHTGRLQMELDAGPQVSVLAQTLAAMRLDSL